MNHEEFDPKRFISRTVKEMSPDEQPREKLARYGAESLTDSELLAILLRTGTRKMNVLQTAGALLDYFNGLRMLVRNDWQTIRAIPGIGKVKAITLEAAFELARRIQTASLGEKIIIRSPEDAAAYFMPLLRDLNLERFMVGFLNHSKVLTGHKIISRGGSNSTIVEPAEVMRSAILNNASSIILAHNHPSGHARESAADISLTRRISEAGKQMGIPVEDHIIIADDRFVSLRNKNLV